MLCSIICKAIAGFREVLDKQQNNIDSRNTAEDILQDRHATAEERQFALQQLQLLIVDEDFEELEKDVTEYIPDWMREFDRWFTDRGYY